MSSVVHLFNRECLYFPAFLSWANFGHSGCTSLAILDLKDEEAKAAASELQAYARGKFPRLDDYAPFLKFDKITASQTRRTLNTLVSAVTSPLKFPFRKRTQRYWRPMAA